MFETRSSSHDEDAAGRLEPLSELSTERIWGMLESAPDGMLMTDHDGVILAVNGQVERLFGYDRGELLGRPIEILLPDRFRDVHRADRTRYRAAPTIRSMGVGLELLARRQDGSEFPVEVSLSPLQDDHGLAVVASVRDVSEQRAAEALTQRIQAAIDAVHDGVFIFDEQLRFVYANDGACAQTGYSRDELLAMTPLHIKPDFTKESFAKILAPLAAGDVERQSFRTVHRRKDGRDVPVDIILEHGVHRQGEALFTALVRDVTERIEIERQLEQSERRFRTSFENAPVGMVMSRIGDQGARVIERVNESFAQMLGRTCDELVGVDLGSLTHPDDKNVDARAAQQMVAGTRDLYTTEKRYARADGSFVWTLFHSSVIDRADGAVTLAHVVDITDRRERQVERERMTKMEDRDRIARDLHDLVIQRLFAAGMKLQSVIPEIGSEVAVQRTHETIDELDAAIRELRSTIFALHERQRSTSLIDEVRASAAAMASTLGFDPIVDIDPLVDELSTGVAEHVLSTLREALSNVARHASADQVSVTVSLRDETLQLQVIDDGVGIQDEAAPGRGLANMAERAERLGGTCETTSPEAGGTGLTWTVPVRPR